MAIPSYGAAPLAKTFLIIRALQLVCFTVIIGITANFVSEIVSANGIPPQEILVTLTIASLAALYTLLTIPFFWAQASLGLFIMAGFDFALLIAFVVVAITLGKPISYLKCFKIPKTSDASATLAFAKSVASNLGKEGNLVRWVGATKANCFETKAAWGLTVALCILFLCSVLLLPALFAKQKRALKTAAKVGA